MTLYDGGLVLISLYLQYCALYCEGHRVVVDSGDSGGSALSLG